MENNKDWRERLYKISSKDSQADTVWYSVDLFDFIEDLLKEERRKYFEIGYGKGESERQLFLEHKHDIPHSVRCSSIPEESYPQEIRLLED